MDLIEPTVASYFFIDCSTPRISAKENSSSVSCHNTPIVFSPLVVYIKEGNLE